MLTVSSGTRHNKPDPAFEAARKAEIESILNRGNIAVFTRAHSIISSITVTKKVKEWKQDGEDLITINNGYVAWWSDEYSLSEEPGSNSSSKGPDSPECAA